MALSSQTLSLKSRLGSLALLLLLLSPMAAGQLMARPTDVAKSVDRRMRDLPKEIHLKPAQKAKLRKLLIQTAEAEQEVMMTTNSKFEQRRQIGHIAANLRIQIRKVLTPAQVVIFEKPRPLDFHP